MSRVEKIVKLIQTTRISVGIILLLLMIVSLLVWITKDLVWEFKDDDEQQVVKPI